MALGKQKGGTLKVANRFRYDSSRKLRMLSKWVESCGDGDNYPLYPSRKERGVAPHYVPVNFRQGITEGERSYE
ncbi:hypothetical protein [Methylacidiphilum kamchatkense]|uniref:hypothetical protein n=1 Tax=Methylacidiphilum kamchatkense TaxID=431057 RepID=UPI00155AAF5E|nr:hypothetical protein [Methylacidiphilum kamchatkense]